MEEKESCHIPDLLNQICSVYTWVELPCSLKKIKISHIVIWALQSNFLVFFKQEILFS